MDFAHLLAPISRTALSCLLSSLKEIGELEQEGRQYRLSRSGDAARPSSSIYGLPQKVRDDTHTVLTRLTQDLGHSCALFAKVGHCTMKIMDVVNLPAPHCTFRDEGNELPLLPFHAFARLFLAYESEALAREAFRLWQPYLNQPHLRIPSSEDQLLSELAQIRRSGRSLEYKAALRPVMRLAVPVEISGWPLVRFAVGLVANFVYLVELESQAVRLRAAAGELAELLGRNVASTIFCSFSDGIDKCQPAESAMISWPTPAHAGAERTRIAS